MVDDLRFDDGCGENSYAIVSKTILSEQPLAESAPADARTHIGLTVYRNNVRAAYLCVLAQTFPVLQRLVGEEFFRYLAHAYFHACTPRSPLVVRYGEKMPTFLETFAAAEGYPYLPDIARFELAWLEAYHAPEAEPLTAAQFAKVASGAADATCFAPHPSLRLLSSPWPVHTIWDHNRRANPGSLDAPAGGENTIIVRPRQQVETSLISACGVRIIRALIEGRSFAETIDCVGETKFAGAIQENFPARIFIPA